MKVKFLLLIFVIFCARNGLFGGATGLTLVDESLPQVFSIIERLTNKTVLWDQNLPDVKISLNLPEGTSQKEVVRALESVLSINGVALIDRDDGFLRVVNARMAVNQSPEWIVGSTLDMPVSDKVYAKLFTLKYLPVATFSGLVRQILSLNLSAVIPFEEANSLLITDRLSNLQRLEVLIKNVDKPRALKIKSKIFRIKHGDAKNISTVLNKLVVGRSEQPQSAQEHEPMPLARPTIPPMSALKDSAQGDFKLSRDVSIECDEYSNSVIVCGNEQDIKQIEDIINELDILLDQVRIEVVIAQVRLTDTQTSGLEALGISYNSVTDAQGISKLSGDNQVKFSGDGASSTRVSKGLHVDGTLNNFSLNYIFNKARSSNNVTVLSAPTIVTTHNREASVKVGESRPIITANFTDLQNPKSIRNSVNYKDIGIELVVTPLIGQNGIIQMKIDQRIQKINGEVTVDGNSQPIISNRQAESFVSVHDGDVVVLAGLQEKEMVDSRGKLWLLGYLPVVGDLFFSPKTKFEETNELIIFIRPTIVVNPSTQDEYYQKFFTNSSVDQELESYERDKKFLKTPEELEPKIEDKKGKKRNRWNR